ncbi:recombinase family protein [Uniformispora flossi]|uniref:recombinase family protein n=1 Tax=Uniformispora flossi TaxID=3390723 RepID=UPI003C2CE4C1
MRLRGGRRLRVPRPGRLGCWAGLRRRRRLRRREIGFSSLHERLDTTTPGGRLVFHVFAAPAEFIRELIVSGTREGLAASRCAGVIWVRPAGGSGEPFVYRLVDRSACGVGGLAPAGAVLDRLV